MKFQAIYEENVEPHLLDTNIINSGDTKIPAPNRRQGQRKSLENLNPFHAHKVNIDSPFVHRGSNVWKA